MDCTYSFARATINDVPEIMRLIDERIYWMDTVGINQWNKNHYRERYPYEYFVSMATERQLFVLKDTGSNVIVAAAVLLTKDYRWNADDANCYYVHNLVSAVCVKEAGKCIMKCIEQLGKRESKSFIRLDCIVGNKHLNQWYETLGYKLVGTTIDGEYTGNLREKEL